jgi:Recombinase zinc beta ribbon domain/Recombinase
MMLKHPLYTGSYVYGRRQEDPRRKQPERPRSGRVVMATDEWLVLLPKRCPAYISTEQYERTQARLQANRARADAMGVARSGSALLAGLVVCARCGCRLTVHYDDGGTRLHTYECVERWTRLRRSEVPTSGRPVPRYFRQPASPRRLGTSCLGVVAPTGYATRYEQASRKGKSVPLTPVRTKGRRKRETKIDRLRQKCAPSERLSMSSPKTTNLGQTKK